MKLEQRFTLYNSFLMEGALGERLKREYHLAFDENVTMAKLVYSSEGRKALIELWGQYIAIAKSYGLPFLATTPTRRANKERVKLAGTNKSIINDNVSFLRDIQRNSNIDMYVGGLMGCKGDAYTGEGALTKDEAHMFHSWQANAFRDAGADFLYAGIMPTLSEAIGMAEAMSDTHIPYIISFTIQRDGTLIDGTKICDAIHIIDDAVIHKPLCYMTNCVHPTIVYEALSQPFNHTDIVQSRFLGVQANTSPLSYAELDHSEDLKCSESAAFAEDMIRLRNDMHFKIMGGCCGTDNRHMEAVARRL
ncbi:MAG TPA: homocysteine S-methyltransferase family protein [Mobilitalea sp.]|nr:homocysteine S-methyltransferase family protein [Mobilitalea sp.]